MLVLPLLLLLLLLLPPAGAYAPSSSSRPPPIPTSQRRSTPAAAAAAGATPRRTHALRLVAGALGLAAASATLAVPPRPALARAPGGVRSLVNLIRVQSYVKELGATLATGAAPPEVMAQIKYIVKNVNMRQSVDEAAATLGGGEAARRHGRDAFEYVSSIIEFTGWDELKKPGNSKFNTLSTPESVAFARRCLEACDRELDAFFAAFPRRKVEEARDVYRAYFAPEEAM